MGALFQRKSAMILALALSLAVTLIVLASDTELRERLGMTYWVLGLAIIGSILLVLAGYVWDRTLIDRLREINEKARNQRELAEQDHPKATSEAADDFQAEQDEIIGVARQIERMAQSLQKMEASYRGIVEDQVDLICRYRADGTLTFANSAFASFFGQKRSQLVGSRFKIFDLGYPRKDFQGNLPDRDSFTCDLTPAESDVSTTYQWTHRAIKTAGDKILEYQAVGHDISDRIAAEAALIEAKEAAESADKAKSEFLTVVSHEVRTPINAVLGFSKLLRDTDLTKDQAEYVTNIHHSGVTLEGLIADILDVSRLEAGQLEIEDAPFALRECVADLHTQFKPITQQAGLGFNIKVDPNVPVIVNGDQTRLRQVMKNMIGNAVKFTEHGRIDVSVTCARSTEVDSDGVCKLRLFVEIADTGIGIPANRIKELFKPFNQMDSSSTRRRGGTGLGLVISKRLCELMGGAISVDSEPDRGSTFRFSIAMTYLKGDSKPPVSTSQTTPPFPANPSRS
jgi:PAS domain S-box-containing protein